MAALHIHYGSGGIIVNYKIIVDSCGELTYKMKKSGVYELHSAWRWTAILS